MHVIPTVGSEDPDKLPVHHAEDARDSDKWFDRCVHQGLSTTHASTLSTFINQFEITMKDHHFSTAKSS
jgi:hypothetical protein